MKCFSPIRPWVFIFLLSLPVFSQVTSNMDKLFQRDYSGFLKNPENIEAIKSWSDLHWAAALGDLQTIRSLKMSSDFNVEDSRGWTPLHWAVIFIENVETIDLLLKLEAKLKAKTNKGETVLHIAVEYGPLDNVEWLLEVGANKEAEDKNGERPSHKAAYLGKQEALELLIQYGADKEARDKLGRRPLHLAAMGGQQGTAELLLLSEVDVNAKDSLDERPLHKAVLTGDPDFVKLFLEFGADREAMMASGETSLHRAVKLDFFDIAKVLLTEFVEIDLYDYVNLRDTERRTALHYAVSTKSKKLVALLVNAGANIFLEDLWGETPLSRAKDLGDMGMYRFLEKRHKKFMESMKDLQDSKKISCGY